MKRETFPDRVLEDLLAAAARACDAHGDGDSAREAMRADCIAVHPAQRAELLEHFRRCYSSEMQSL